MKEMEMYRSEIGKPVIVLICGTLVYYHCAHRNSSLVSLVSDVLIVLLCSLAILGLLFRQMNISVPVDPLEWQISQDTANSIVAWIANTVGAAESVLRVAATGHDKRLFFKDYAYFAFICLRRAVSRSVHVCLVFWGETMALQQKILKSRRILCSHCFSNRRV
ncbi:reticulon-like protein B23 isoform X2 [Rosa chinensis]|uniref:reticulon-like protein B23 isoform X2 n=1 Tax=Rosa chinensis TaxID=74649 RepID=UPI000D08C30B|nr:reticulon-like protein B23 isoform X2 [Rosa chinensis]